MNISKVIKIIVLTASIYQIVLILSTIRKYIQICFYFFSSLHKIIYFVQKY